MIRVARRVIAALSVAGLVAALVRVRGKGGVPPQSGGWREVSDTELRAKHSSSN